MTACATPEVATDAAATSVELSEGTAERWRSLLGTGAGGLQAENPSDVSEAVRSADVVVVGRFNGVVKPSRTFEGSPGDAIQYIVLELEVEQIVLGRRRDQGGRPVAFEVPLGENEELADVRRRVPTDRALFFLRNKATSAEMFGAQRDLNVESKYYRLLRSDAVLVQGPDSRAVLTNMDESGESAFQELAGREFGQTVAAAARTHARDRHLGKPPTGWEARD